MHQIYYNMFDSAFTAIARTFLSHFPMSLKGFYLGKIIKRALILGGTERMRSLTNNFNSSVLTTGQNILFLHLPSDQTAIWRNMNSVR